MALLSAGAVMGIIFAMLLISFYPFKDDCTAIQAEHQEEMEALESKYISEIEDLKSEHASALKEKAAEAKSLKLKNKELLDTQKNLVDYEKLGTEALLKHSSLCMEKLASENDQTKWNDKVLKNITTSLERMCRLSGFCIEEKKKDSDCELSSI